MTNNDESIQTNKSEDSMDHEEVVKQRERAVTVKSIKLATIFGIPVITLFIYPIFTGAGSRYFTDTFAFVFLYAAMALSLNLEVGYLGLPNFGKVAFIAVGAYTYAMVENYQIKWFGGVVLTGIILAVLVTGIMGIILTLPTLKLKESYLAIVTIVVGEILRMVLNNEDSLGGYSGFPVTNVFYSQYNPDKTMSGFFLELIPFILVLATVGLGYLGYRHEYNNKITIFNDESKSMDYAYDRMITISALMAMALMILNFLGYLGEPSLGLDVFIILIPIFLTVGKQFSNRIKIRDVVIGICTLSITSLVMGFINPDATSTIYVVNWYFMLFSFGVMAIIYVIMQEIQNSPFGRALRAIREDDTSSISVGKSVFGFRLRALFMANALTGLAGAAFALLLSSVTPQTFLPMLTFLLYIMVIVGGRGNNKGVIFGAIVIQLLIQSSRRLSNLTMYYPFFTQTDYLEWGNKVNPFNLALIIVGITLIIFLIYAPEGIFPEKSRNNERYTDLLYLNDEDKESLEGNKLIQALQEIPKYASDLSSELPEIVAKEVSK